MTTFCADASGAVTAPQSGTCSTGATSYIVADSTGVGTVTAVWAPLTVDASAADLGAVWIFGFSTVVSLWWIAKNLGLILSFIRRS